MNRRILYNTVSVFLQSKPEPKYTAGYKFKGAYKQQAIMHWWSNLAFKEEQTYLKDGCLQTIKGP